MLIFETPRASYFLNQNYHVVCDGKHCLKNTYTEILRRRKNNPKKCTRIGIKTDRLNIKKKYDKKGSITKLKNII